MSVPAHPAPPKRLIWPWVLGAGLVVVGSGIIFIASFLVSGMLASLADTRQEAVVSDAVLAFDAAYDEQDCAAFRTLVDDDLADQLVGGHFTCRSWVAIADSLHQGGDYQYSVEVVSAWVEGNLAGVYTEEYDSASRVAYYNYTLERSDDGWVITRYDRE